jgi:ABC-type branched-subunit amino acid transport system substrate-binding protein
MDCGSVSQLRRIGLVFAAAAVVCGCSSKWFRRAAAVAGEEAAYAALGTYLVKAGVKSADHMVDAVRLAVEKKDYGAAAGAFVVALNEHNLRASQRLTSAQVIGYMRLAEPGVRKASQKVADGLRSFCEYVSAH